MRIVGGIVGAVNDTLAVFVSLIIWLGVLVTIVANSIRQLIQRGHLGYDVGDVVAKQTLVNAEGRPLGSGGTEFVRQLAHFVDSLVCFIGYFFPLWDAKGQTLADKIMNTTVVTDRPHRYESKELVINSVRFWEPVIKN